MPSSQIATVKTHTFLRRLQRQPGTTVNAAAVRDTASALGLPEPTWYLDRSEFRRADGTYVKADITTVEALGVGYPAMPRGRKAAAPPPTIAPAVADSTLTDLTTNGVPVMFAAEAKPVVPLVLPQYRPWGHYSTVQTLVASKQFFSMMLVGPPGNGKTELFEQVCANLGREYVRINITTETDEDDLIGGFRLINGETWFALGPVPMGMLTGAVINLDEIDLGGAMMMCLQPVLEGKPLYIKKLGRYIYPTPGFAVGATANTKGRGDDGRYMYTNIMNSSTLDRFTIMCEQTWPSAQVETSILVDMLTSHGVASGEAKPLATDLVSWATATRQSFEEQRVPDQISTRRLIHLCRAYAILKDFDIAMTSVLTHFDRSVALAFRKVWDATSRK